MLLDVFVTLVVVVETKEVILGCLQSDAAGIHILEHWLEMVLEEFVVEEVFDALEVLWLDRLFIRLVGVAIDTMIWHGVSGLLHECWDHDELVREGGFVFVLALKVHGGWDLRAVVVREADSDHGEEGINCLKEERMKHMSSW